MSREDRILRTLIPAGQRAKWLLVALMGIVAAGAESVAALVVAALIAAMTSLDGAALVLPVLGDVTEWLPGGTPEGQLQTLALIAGGFFIIRASVQLVRAYVQSRIAARAGSRISARLFRGYLALPYSFHISHNSSELIRNASWAADEVVTNYLMPIASIITQTFMLIFLLAVLIAAAPTITAATIGILVPLTILVVQSVRPALRRLGHVSKRTVQESINTLQQSLHGIRDVKVLGRERFFGRDFRDSREELARARYLSVSFGLVPAVSIETLVIVIIVSFVAVTSSSGVGTFALPTIGLFAYAGLRMMPATSSVVSSVNKIRYGHAVAEAVAESLNEIDEAAEMPPPLRDVETLSLNSALQLTNVNFSYSEDQQTLVDINLSIKRGESVGIVGETGAGKSTLLDLVLGLLAPSSGTVSVDGTPIRDNLRGWHSTIGLVPQSIYLLDDTIRRNIGYGLADDQIDESAVADAVKLAQLESFIDSLPDGLDTIVGERGVRLSGGQRQRVAIARALYRRPSVLILDEGTASLDNVTEAELLRAIEDLRGEHTILTVAHRLTTVRNCDQIILLEDGRITDQGTYEELQNRNPTFKRMTS